MGKACKALGHRYRFDAVGVTLRWRCARCGDEHARRYATPADARRMAAALDREDRDSLGRRAPWFGLLPLRMWRSMRDRAERGAA